MQLKEIQTKDYDNCFRTMSINPIESINMAYNSENWAISKTTHPE